MIDKLRKLITWLQTKVLPTWFTGNSWLNEWTTGMVGTAILMIIGLGPFFGVLMFQLISFVYERWVDPNNWSFEDFAQRALGSFMAGWIFLVIGYYHP